ncbi:J domain-containing protein [Rhizobium lusitanum]|uniref:J domain-containing protein n=1 Tax=Rhizobium lusitanum TaxID=293958 RepID=A0A6L9U9U0_9HYPH|nr:J domain-containing protein [Rhizobium lusitanum]NEI71066.1 J domain-containing protein [Rhizobium lusitanum]
MIPYPLQWPDHIPRYQKPRENGQFRTSLAGATKNVKESLRLFASDSGKPLQNVVISSNYTLGVDKPSDPGVAVWFVWDSLSVCIPVDRYSKVEANLQAIHHILEARRVELRHGTLALVRATFAGFTALPSPETVAKRSWREVFGFGPTEPISETYLKDRYRAKSKYTHPDQAGGSKEAFEELTRARDEGLEEIRRGRQ